MAERPLLDWKRLAVGFAVALTFASCSGKKTKPTTPELSQLEGKKVALTSVEGEPTARKIIEVALVNQLVKRGTFVLVPKEDVEAARVAPTQDPTDDKGIALRAGADYALKAKVEDFSAKTTSGYSTVDENDSQLEAETGDGKTQRLYKVREMVGNVAVKLTFIDTHTGEVRSAVAESGSSTTAESKDRAEYLPPKLRFLESVANDAFQKFFEKY